MRRTDRNKLLTLLFLCLTVLASAAVPDWMREATSQTLPSYPPDTDAIVLLDDSSITIQGPGEYIEHYRRVVKILRQEGNEYADLHVYLKRDEKVQLLHGWSVDAAGHEYEVKDKDFAEMGSHPTYVLYEDDKFRHTHMPAAQPGTVIGFEYEVRRHEWLNQISWFIQEQAPVRQAVMTVQLPAGWEYKTSWAEYSPREPARAGENRWQWILHDVPRLEDEPRMPSYRALSGRMFLTYFGPGQPNSNSWQAIGNWYRGLSEERRNLTPPIAERVHQLTGANAGLEAKVRALTTFMQDEIRYVAIEIGIGGFQPHYAGDVFRSRYGDCKDKVTLLSTMLQEAGVRSQYFLITTYRGAVNPTTASPWFNHAIIAIELPAGEIPASYEAVVTAKTGLRYLLFDPTDTYTPVGKLRGELQDSYGLLVTETGGELIHTPLLRPASNLLSRQGHFTIDADGTLSGELLEERTGDHAMIERLYMAHANDQERMQRLERRLNHSLKGFSLRELQIQQPTDLQEKLKLSVKLTAPLYGQVRGPLLLVRPRVVGEKSFGIEHKPRHYSLEMGAPAHEVDRFELDVPPGYQVDDLPDGQNVDFGFASYHSKYESQGSKIQYWREYDQKDVSVPAGKIEDVRKLESLIGADEQSVVILKRVN